MKNNEKRQFSKGKIVLLGITFVLSLFMFKTDLVFAASCEGLSTQVLCSGRGDCYWWESESGSGECYDEILFLECNKLKQPGCVYKSQCRWDGGHGSGNNKCIPRSSKMRARALSKWEEKDCKSTSKHLRKDLVELVSYKLDKNGEEKEKPLNEACEELRTNAGDMYICDYPEWMTNSGKRKCRNYLSLIEKSRLQDCLEMAESIFQRGLKDNAARIVRQKSKEDCQAIIQGSYYEGPIFGGPGLRGGAQMAQMELSNSISKQRDLKKLIIDWAKFILELAVVLAVIAIMWAGFRYITDMGDGAGLEAAKKIIIWTVVGLILILSSYAIVNTVIKAGHGSDRAAASVINHLKT
jgi:hypothetical protein